MAGESVREVLNHLWSALEPLGYPCALMGGVALAVWNHPRATRDVDLLVGVDCNNLEPIINQLRACGCRIRREPPLVTVGSHHFLQFLYTPPGEFYDVPFDLLLAESEFQNTAIARRVSRDLPGLARPIDVLNCDDLILFKLLSGRMIDRADAAMLLRENRDAIDLNYFLSWVDRLNLSADFLQIWQEAYPDQDPPTIEIA